MILERWNQFIHKGKALKFGAMQVRNNPSSWIAFLDSVNSPYSKAAVNLLARVTEPKVAANGLKIVAFDDETLVAQATSSFFNRNHSGHVSTATAVELVEFCLQRFWQRHLVAGVGQFQLSSITLDWESTERGDLRAKFALGNEERGEIMRRLPRDLETIVEFDIPLFNRSEKIVAHARGSCKLTTSPLLPSSTSMT